MSKASAAAKRSSFARRQGSYYTAAPEAFGFIAHATGLRTRFADTALVVALLYSLRSY